MISRVRAKVTYRPKFDVFEFLFIFLFLQLFFSQSLKVFLSEEQALLISVPPSLIEIRRKVQCNDIFINTSSRTQLLLEWSVNISLILVFTFLLSPQLKPLACQITFQLSGAKPILRHKICKGFSSLRYLHSKSNRFQ